MQSSLLRLYFFDVSVLAAFIINSAADKIVQKIYEIVQKTSLIIPMRRNVLASPTR